MSRTFVVDQDVNATTFTSDTTDVGEGTEISYKLSGGGAFDLVLHFYESRDASNEVATTTVSSGDGSVIDGTVELFTDYVEVEVVDQSGASNTVTGATRVKGAN